MRYALLLAWMMLTSLVCGDVVGCGTSVAHASDPARLRKPVVEIWKARHRMELRDGHRVVRQFEVALGLQPKETKLVRGDYRTPVGDYYVSDKNPSQRFHRFVGISYPNVEDAERGYVRRLIGADEWADIFLANVQGKLPTWRTPLGGRIGIHGYGGRPPFKVDWTEGCIAITDEEIEFLYERVPVGTPVIIHE